MSPSNGTSGPLDNDSASSEQTSIQPIFQMNHPQLFINDIEYIEREVKRYREEAEMSKTVEDLGETQLMVQDEDTSGMKMP